MCRIYHAVLGFVLLNALLSIEVRADSGSGTAIQVSGYYKNFLASSRTLALYPPQTNYWVDFNRLRLEFKGNINNTRYNVQYDNEFSFGDYLKTSQFIAQKNLISDNYFNLYQTYVDNNSVYARHGLYRAYIDNSIGAVDIRSGRQRVAWGSGLFWSPVDIINPFDPTQIEREERTGVDAILADCNYGELSRLSLVYAAHSTPTRATTAFRWRNNLSGFDIGLTGGHFRNDDMVGLDFAGQWHSIGLRGEWTQTSSPVDGGYQRAVLSGDYTAPSSLSIFLELYYNGQGKSDPASYQFTRLFNGEIQSLAQRYLGMMVGYDFTPVLKWKNYYIHNFDDGSGFLYSRLIYSSSENEEWSAGAQMFAGNTGSEYGAFENINLIQYQRYF